MKPSCNDRLRLTFEEQCTVTLLMLPAQKEGALLDVIWPWSNQWECALFGRNFQQYNIALYLSCIIFHCFSAVHLFKNFRHLFSHSVSNGLAIRFSSVHLPCVFMPCSFLRNVFTWEVTYFLLTTKWGSNFFFETSYCSVSIALSPNKVITSSASSNILVFPWFSPSFWWSLKLS